MEIRSAPIIWSFGYILLFLALAVGVFVYRVKRHGSRSPVAFKLLRGPGESLRRRMVAFDEGFFLSMLMASAVPPLPLLPLLLLMKKVGVTTWAQLWCWIAVGFLVFGVTLYFTLRWVFKQMTRYRNDRLGYLGEREVAEHLRPLLAKGYHVYHDVPAQGTKKPFNLDHVAVGPAGVTVIEVKTVRKGKARAGYKDYVVSFDGAQLVWPWAENRHGLDQALSEAEWLQRFLFERLGLDTQVKAVLALPGWWVETVARGPV